jgi:hypothetical protein
MDYYEWTDKRTGEVHQVPKGIDPGWDYSPGKSAWGKKLSDQAMSRWRAEGANAYQRLTPGDWKTYTRPELIPADPPQASIGEKLTTVGAAQNRLEDLLGDREKIFTFQADDFRHDILVNAESLAKHIDLERTPYLPFLPEALEDPFEVWLSFERHKGTKQVMLRQRVIKSIQLDKDRGLLLVAQSKNGIMEAWTIIPVSNMKYLQKQRIGQLIWGRK